MGQDRKPCIGLRPVDANVLLITSGFSKKSLLTPTRKHGRQGISHVCREAGQLHESSLFLPLHFTLQSVRTGYRRTVARLEVEWFDGFDPVGLTVGRTMFDETIEAD